MAKQYKIGIVGNRNAIMPFHLVGFDMYPVTSGQEAVKVLKQLAEDDYGIIYLTEEIAAQIPDTIRYYDTQLTPAVILIPTHRGSLGIGKQRVQENVEKAVGQNILE
ncbi:V-type ATP synthase subunit F [Dolosicoccus paucivorans]|uniref:V-type ATP synthase subunit F n=1 Tax=Dolosicoccus paucivorans TaxID=84521 RepID=A0A1G8JCD6_9LACT|nr:V-type ATP synthase subunit F [Dolosicoccus paucivorans]PMB84496.1 V-type ATP synthase subunit F [Dolosicoccus paucivorans]PMC58384.1 V-type ATP synthase subunit F [Dolosicoccus paucivorans]SDI28918.1 V/A-type H+-transporting ATPase subunit F [Dolosicoccus paucivorans]